MIHYREDSWLDLALSIGYTPSLESGSRFFNILCRMLNDNITKHGWKKISEDTMLTVLERAAEDITFYGQLEEDYVKALQNYDLTREEQTAFASGDVCWMESYINRKLDERIMSRVLMPLLSQEKW